MISKIFLFVGLILLLLKFLFMLVVLILKVKHLNKRNENEELSSICKTIVGIDIEFRWLNIYYSNYWRVITKEQEDIYINASINKNK